MPRNERGAEGLILSCLPDAATQSVALLAQNAVTAEFGLMLTAGQAAELAAAQGEALRESGRIDFSGGIGPQLIRTFAGSPYLRQRGYADTLAALTRLFYRAKSESDDRVDDEGLLQIMRERFDGCGGDTDALADAMAAFARQVRAARPDPLRNIGPTEDE